MSAQPWVIDVGDDDFEREVRQRSATTPVVVDFWAPWCGPCRTLGPVLERLTAEHTGAFVLAKVNVDEAPAVAQAFRVQSIPAVKGFRDGALVAEFVGAQPEAVVRELLARVLPSEADRLVAEAATLRAPDAEAKLESALALEPRHGRGLVALAHRKADAGDVTGALDLLSRVTPPSPVLADAERLAAELRMRTADGADFAALQARVAEQPGDLGARARARAGGRASLRRRPRRVARGGAARSRLRGRRSAQGHARRLRGAGRRRPAGRSLPERARQGALQLSGASLRPGSG
jgi:putative thioredoxin